MKEANPIQIINALKAGNRLALAKLYDMYADIIYGLALEIVKEDALAEEVLQDTFIKVWQRIDQYDEQKSRFFSWVYKIGRNTAIDKYRTIKNHKPIDSSIMRNGYVVEGQYNNHIDTASMLSSLEEPYERVIRMSYIHGHSQSEISKLLEVPLGTVKSRIRIGLKKLKQLYKNPELVNIVLVLHSISSFYG